MTKKKNAPDSIIKILLLIIAIPIGILLAMCDSAKKQK